MCPKIDSTFSGKRREVSEAGGEGGGEKGSATGT